MESSLLSFLSIFSSWGRLLLNSDQHWWQHWSNLQVAHEARVLHYCCCSLESLILYSNMKTVDAEVLCREPEEERFLQQLVNYLASPLLSHELILLPIKVSELNRTEHKWPRNSFLHGLIEVFLNH